MVTMAQTSTFRELAQHAHSRRSHPFSHTYITAQLQPRCAKRQLSLTPLWNRIFIVKVTKSQEPSDPTSSTVLFIKQNTSLHSSDTFPFPQMRIVTSFGAVRISDLYSAGPKFDSLSEGVAL